MLMESLVLFILKFALQGSKKTLQRILPPESDSRLQAPDVQTNFRVPARHAR